jgi:hypothetical protein
MAEKFSAFYGIPKAHYSPHKTFQLTLFWDSLIQPDSLFPVRLILLLPSNVRPDLFLLTNKNYARTSHRSNACYTPNYSIHLELMGSPKHEADHYTILSSLFLPFLPHAYDPQYSFFRSPLCCSLSVSEHVLHPMNYAESEVLTV